MRASEYFALHKDCRECKYSLCCYGGCRADAAGENKDGDIMGKSQGACELFRGGWAEKIIETVRAARPEVKSEVFDSPLWQK